MKQIELNEKFQRILEIEELTFIKTFDTGNSGALVLHTTNPQNKEYVIKINTDEGSLREIKDNIIGFESIREEGLEEILPDITESKSYEDLSYLKLSYLGDDFAQIVKVTTNPLRLYADLKNKMLSIYQRTLKKDDKGNDFLELMKYLIKHNYQTYLFPTEMLRRSEAESHLDFDLSNMTSKYSCFAVFDFTPEDIYLVGKTIKFPDPQPIIRGVPILDMACFAGVSRDVYDLPGSKEGYDLFENFAFKVLAPLLELNYESAYKIFTLGRAIQFALSSRFRIETEPLLAKKYAEKSLEYLRLLNK